MSALRATTSKTHCGSMVCLAKSKMYVKNKTTGDTLTTLTYTDFSFENKFLAYKTFYIFADTDREYTLPEGLTADDIEITAKALGNGKEITDSDVAPAYNHEPFKRVIDFSGFGVPADWTLSGRQLPKSNCAVVCK